MPIVVGDGADDFDTSDLEEERVYLCISSQAQVDQGYEVAGLQHPEPFLRTLDFPDVSKVVQDEFI